MSTNNYPYDNTPSFDNADIFPMRVNKKETHTRSMGHLESLKPKDRSEIQPLNVKSSQLNKEKGDEGAAEIYQTFGNNFMEK